MITWTDSARAALETHNGRVRQNLVATGADPDEVAADLQRHIEEELTAAKIHIATRDEVKRVLGRMGVEGPAPSASAGKSQAILGIAVGLLLVFAIGAVTLRNYRRPVHVDAYSYPPQWLVPTSQDTAALTIPIVLATHTPEWGQFPAGDSIAVTSVKGDRPDFEVGGRYLIEGRYALASAEASGLSVSVTAKRRDVGGISPGHPEEGTLVSRGQGSFRLIATMRYPGDFHVSFNPLQGGQSRGTVYFEKAKHDEIATTLVINLSDDGRISVNGESRTDDELKVLLGQTHATHPDTSVLIKANEKTDAKRLAFVFDSCRAASISRFALQGR